LTDNLYLKIPPPRSAAVASAKFSMNIFKSDSIEKYFFLYRLRFNMKTGVKLNRYIHLEYILNFTLLLKPHRD
jgi:hypothetical protein